MKRILTGLFAMVCLVSFSTSVFLLHRHLVLKHRITTQRTQQLQDLTRSAAADIDRILRQVMAVSDGMAADLSSGALPKNEHRIKQHLMAALHQNPHFYGVQVIYAPYRYQNNLRLFAPYYFSGPGDSLIYRPLEQRYDYTTKDWYMQAMQQGAGWDEPDFCEAGVTLMISYHHLFYETDPQTGKKQIAGDVCIDISLDEIKQIINILDLGPGGFPALVSQGGVYLYHPNNDYVVEHKSLLDLAHASGDTDREFLGQRLLEGKLNSGISDHLSTTTGLASWLAYEPIPTTKWYLLNTFIKCDIPFEVDTFRHQLIWISCLGLISLLFLLLLALHLFPWQRSRKLWLASLAVSATLLSGIGATWILSFAYEPPQHEKRVVILDRTTLNDQKNTYYERSRVQHTEPPLFLPTGVFVDSIRLTGDNFALISGYIWQKFGPNLPKDLNREVTIASAEDIKISECCRFQINGTEIVRWHFQARVQERMSYARYPLDREILNLQVLQCDVSHNVVLLPDIAAYKLINPTSRPGLERHTEIPGWTIDKSFFDMVEQNQDTDFGMNHSVLQGHWPVMRFNILIKRNFIDAFISNLTPLIVVAIMLFLLLLTTTSNSVTQEFMKTGTGHTLSMSSALFFVVIFSHIGIRHRIQVHDIFYLEYFYFVIYAAILGVAVSSILFALAKNLSLIQYQDNLIAKLAYWPSILGTLFAFTLHVFY